MASYSSGFYNRRPGFSNKSQKYRGNRRPAENTSKQDAIVEQQQQKPPVENVPPPPPLDLKNPKYFPFPRLRSRRPNTRITYDEELLRFVVGLFMYHGGSVLDFKFIFDQLAQDKPELLKLLYNQETHLWVYLRTYAEHFVVDKDPCKPFHIWNRKECKIIAKTDPRRYDIALQENRISFEPDVDEILNNIKYDLELETKAIAAICAVFYPFAFEECLEVEFISGVLQAIAPQMSQVIEYIGDVQQFINRRTPVFHTLFGNNIISIRRFVYTDTIRQLTKFLHAKGGFCDLQECFQYFSSASITAEGRQSVCTGQGSEYDRFLQMLFNHSLYFRLYTRDGFVKLRHGTVPDVWHDDIIPMFVLYGNLPQLLQKYENEKPKAPNAPDTEYREEIEFDYRLLFDDISPASSGVDKGWTRDVREDLDGEGQSEKIKDGFVWYDKDSSD